MSLQYPEFLWGLLLLLPIGVVLLRAHHSGRKALQRLYGGSLPDKLATVYYVKWFFSSVFFLAAMVFFILALTGISWGQQPIEDNREQLEIVFVVDVSNSMLAEDVSPNRLARSVELVRGVINGLPQARFGVTAFKGEGTTVIPVTENRYVFDALERLLDPAIITTPWTHIDRGLQAGAQAFPPGSSRNQVLVLFSDGENHGRSVQPIAAELGRSGIPVVAVLTGTADGSLIPIGPDGSPLRDARDQVVVTRADRSLMQGIADASGGILVDANQPGSLGNLISFMEDLEVQGHGFRLVDVPRTRLLVAVGLLLLMCGEMVRVIRWKGVF
ncbi:vWA domain-containing protein [Spirochaeta africana]|uniref:Mg-chelatase subunit ChlD n=1 Tax=Spirochaeta africana (strain ATCC 700263 / DSM 8902 / Z-7692) TaxID=889378 RepID=H9UM20_SPIAZ|nr:VWA domain-containing protein [Spirochaeta africana]AFG38563.1 Mg-chelatase subunit ChlD [Spirochaeta africana DSM 8902]